MPSTSGINNTAGQEAGLPNKQDVNPRTEYKVNGQSVNIKEPFVLVKNQKRLAAEPDKAQERRMTPAKVQAGYEHHM